MPTVLTIGQGEIGTPLTKIFQDAGHKVYAKDLAPLAVEDEVDAMVVSIPFIDKATFIKIVVGYIEMYEPQLVVISSTVLPGTSWVIENLAQAKGLMTKVVHSPVMGRHRKNAPEMMLEDIKAYPKFIGANTDAAYELAKSLFESIGLQCSRMSSSTTSELSKLLETTYSGILIGWAQESERICEQYGVAREETLKMVEAANNRIEFKRPTGVFPGFIGGHCIMPNIELLLQEVKSEYLEAVQNSNARKASETD